MTAIEPKPVRIRSRKHLKFVAKHPCEVCGTVPCQAHHITTAQPNATGKKSGDQWSIALCPHHHGARHGIGNEAKFWEKFKPGFDYMQRARDLAAESPCNRVRETV